MKLRTAIAAAAAAVFTIATPAHAYDYGSGQAGGATGTPVVSTPSYTTQADVLVVGDSITVGNYKALAAQLPGQTLAVNAQSGRGTVDAVNQVLAMPYVPPVVIMATGSNDVFNPPVMAAQIKRLRTALEPRGIKVRWMTVHVVRVRGTAAQQLADQRNSGWVNAQIQAGCTAPCKVIDWATMLAAYPQYRIPAWLRDGVHTTELGKAAWAVMAARGANS